MYRYVPKSKESSSNQKVKIKYLSKINLDEDSSETVERLKYSIQ
jgi:hypothetical protein